MLSPDKFHDTLRERVERLRGLIAGHASHEVTVVAATKTVDAAFMNLLPSVGIFDVGENRAQEYAQKRPLLAPELRRHFIGQLQSNKARAVAEDAYLIHSLDRQSLARELSRVGQSRKRPVDALIEISLAGETQKAGVTEDDLERFAYGILELGGIRVCGLMTVAPYSDDPEDARPVFRKAKRMYEKLCSSQLWGGDVRYLSMGMSGDFTVALEEGANMIRVGSYLFGSRQAHG